MTAHRLTISILVDLLAQGAAEAARGSGLSCPHVASAHRDAESVRDILMRAGLGMAMLSGKALTHAGPWVGAPGQSRADQRRRLRRPRLGLKHRNLVNPSQEDWLTRMVSLTKVARRLRTGPKERRQGQQPGPLSLKVILYVIP